MIDYDVKDAVNPFVFPAGEYDAELLECQEKVSKADNPMYELKWRIFGDNGQNMQLTSYIAFPKMTFQLKRLAQARGKLKEFEKNKFNPADFIGSSVRLVLKVEKPKVTGLDEKNAVAGYLPIDGEKPKLPDNPVVDSDIPF